MTTYGYASQVTNIGPWRFSIAPMMEWTDCGINIVYNQYVV
jgi:hypothetical protein